MTTAQNRVAGRPLLLHPVLEAASTGVLPGWAQAGTKRREHMARVADLMKGWADSRGEPMEDRVRWCAVGYLHDALREADPEAFRSKVEPEFRDLPGKVLHGPGAAHFLAGDGVTDQSILHAVRYHTLGWVGFDTLGLALYAADFLEPGRKRRKAWRADLRTRAVEDLEGVVKEIVSDRVRYLVDRGRPVHPLTMEFWNRFSEGEPWASASEC